ncbi:MAG: thiaminase II [Alphaproteobacteria bacterium]|nr:thiaminase II [Alphaproteobacteria bacterium]
MTKQDYGRAFALWREAAAGPWRAYTQHSFVEQLGNGALPQTAYLHYLRQDYIFLFHFSRAWSLAAAKAATIDEMKAAIGTAHALTHVEMPLHVETCAAHGVSASELESTPEENENIAYTRFVLEAGYSGDFLDLMAALAPCVMGYGEIGLRLAGAHSPYSAWIETYAGKDYQRVCEQAGALIDNALNNRLGKDWQSSPRWPQLCKTFAAACSLEAAFWDMGLRAPQ